MSWHCWKPTGWKRSTESGTTSVYRTVFLFHGRPHMTLMPGQTVGFPYHVCRTMRHVHGQSTNAVVHHCRTISYKTIHIVFQFLPAKVAFCLRLGKALLRTGWKEKIILASLRYFSRKPCITGVGRCNALVVHRAAKPGYSIIN